MFAGASAGRAMFASESPTMEEQVALVSAPQPEDMAVAVPPVNDEAPLVNATCIKAACGGALLLAGIAVGAQVAEPQKEAGGGRGGDAGAPVQLSQARSSASMGKKEIVDLWVGQCGGNIGANFLGGLLAEHQLDVNTGKYIGQNEDVDLARASVYFDGMAGSEDGYRPRTCVIDLDSNSEGSIARTHVARFLKRENTIFEGSGTANNWASGHFSKDAKDVCQEVLERIRTIVETCNCPQGFQLQHSLGGGTGSGMGTLLLQKLKNGYGSCTRTTFSVFPSPKVTEPNVKPGEEAVEPYNCVLSVPYLLTDANVTILLDNEGLYNVSRKNINPNPTISNLNTLIQSAMMGATAPWRFNSNVVTDMRRLTTSIVPLPRLQFINISHSGLIPAHAGKDINQIVSDVHSFDYLLSNIRPTDGKYMCGAHCFRGEGALSAQELVKTWKAKSNDALAWWSPYGILSGVAEGKTTVTDPAARQGPGYNTQDVAATGTFLSNTTATKGLFARIRVPFMNMFRRKLYTHWYTSNGVEESDFQDAIDTVQDLVTEYQSKQDAVEPEPEEESEWDEESSSSEFR